ncbi:hypothetical protein [Sutcliffiella horikoshii]|uniref:hypothetical protein n=1 Tax=Sutcliffiella horikoshii TaxID=79883 RepID=UPI00165367AF|nr:hypothetical protein [Sutcliffiella horikoshii]
MGKERRDKMFKFEIVAINVTRKAYQGLKLQKLKAFGNREYVSKPKARKLKGVW